MKRILWAVLAVVAFTVLIISCATPPKSSKAEAKWINNMHRLSAAHLKLLPLAADGRKFADPTERAVIRDHIKQLVEASTAIVNDHKAPNADPLIAFTAAQLANETRQAYSAFELNDMQWSRFALNRVSSQCISCHTRGDRGVKDFESRWVLDTSSLSAVQSVEYLLANRRYQSALTQANRLAVDGTAAVRDPRSWILALERTLGMVVRVNKDPAQAESLTTAVVNNESAPRYIRRNAAAWLEDIHTWKGEAKLGRRRDKFHTAVQLVERAQNSGPRNAASLITYLRASGMLHEVLEDSSSANYGEALLYAGLVADSLRDLNMGFLDQYYFESCIYHKPHSRLAERCFTRLEASVRDANPFLELDPENESLLAARLADFRTLAEAKDPLDDPRWRRRFWDDDLGGEKSNERERRGR